MTERKGERARERDEKRRERGIEVTSKRFLESELTS